MQTFTFVAEIIEWRGPAPFIYARIPADAGTEIARYKRLASYGWGVIPVDVEIDGQGFSTSLFPRDRTYLVPLRQKVREALGLTVGDSVTLCLRVRGLDEAAPSVEPGPRPSTGSE